MICCVFGVLKDLVVRLTRHEPVVDLEESCFKALRAVPEAAEAFVPSRDQVIAFREAAWVVHAETESGFVILI